MKKQFFIYLIFLLFLLFSCTLSVKNNIQKISRCTSEIDSLLTIEQETIDELNFARTNPKQYASILEVQKQYYKGNTLSLPNEIPLITNEGVAALDEAIDFLNSTSALSSLEVSDCLCLSARDHVYDTGPLGIVEHNGSDGSTPYSRANRYVSPKLYGVGENISYGCNTARGIIIQLIVDDGVPSRGHRENIFDESYKSLGAGFGGHSIYKNMCVIVFSSDKILPK